jgi:hypothetical protein
VGSAPTAPPMIASRRSVAPLVSDEILERGLSLSFRSDDAMSSGTLEHQHRPAAAVACATDVVERLNRELEACKVLFCFCS